LRLPQSRPREVSLRSLSAFIFLFLATFVSGQSATDFTGHWQQKTTSGAQRHLEIEQNGRNLRAKTVVTNSQGTRNLEVKYEIGGPQTVYTGLDGDQFRSSVRWDGNALVFDTIEQEAGNELPQKTVWTLLGDGDVLQVDRTMTKSGKTTHSLTTYVRLDHSI
jgi:hypothetical protein